MISLILVLFAVSAEARPRGAPNNVPQIAFNIKSPPGGINPTLTITIKTDQGVVP